MRRGIQQADWAMDRCQHERKGRAGCGRMQVRGDGRQTKLKAYTFKICRSLHVLIHIVGGSVEVSNKMLLGSPGTQLEIFPDL